MAIGTFHSMAWQQSDVLYSPLPQYHTSGGCMGTCTALLHGATVVQRRKFSVSRFWTDCIQYQCTVRPPEGLRLAMGKPDARVPLAASGSAQLPGRCWCML